MHISLKPSSGMTAAQLAVLRSTGMTMSHSAAVHQLRGENALARTPLHRLVGTISPADAINAATRAAAIEQAPRTACTGSPKQLGCTANCGQGRRCTCSGTPARTGRLEAAMSDFGILDLAYREDSEPTEAEIDRSLTPAARVAAKVWPTVWRVFLGAFLMWVAMMIAGCGGGDVEDDDTTITPAMPTVGTALSCHTSAAITVCQETGAAK